MSVESELKLIAERLIALSSQEDCISDMKQDHILDADYNDKILANIARTLLKLRRDRKNIFSADIFGEPGWDMMLDMFINHTHSKRISVKSLCFGSGVPTTTALRWINVLVEEGLLSREPSLSDRRLTYLNLTQKGYMSIRKCLVEYRSGLDGVTSSRVFMFP